MHESAFFIYFTSNQRITFKGKKGSKFLQLLQMLLVVTIQVAIILVFVLKHVSCLINISIMDSFPVYLEEKTFKSCSRGNPALQALLNWEVMVGNIGVIYLENCSPAGNVSAANYRKNPFNQ